MVVDLTIETWGVVLIGAIAALALAWYLVARYAGRTHLERHARHFLDAGDVEMPPEEIAKQRHPGAGGFG